MFSAIRMHCGDEALFVRYGMDLVMDTLEAKSLAGMDAIVQNGVWISGQASVKKLCEAKENQGMGGIATNRTLLPNWWRGAYHAQEGNLKKWCV